MFPRGPRFEPFKAPDGPAPNAYNPTQDSQSEAYKRGAFLEKANRFNKDKDDDIPGPGTYNTDLKKSISAKALVKPQQGLNERYNILQKKLEDLERVHQDGKKAHQVEVERLKSELSRCQKTISEQTERIDKQKKQTDTLDFRIQELKKAAQANQAEIKALKAKHKMLENEKTQLAGRQGDIVESKKAMQALESKHKDELKERDRRIAELEKSVSSESKKREALETRLQDLKAKGDTDAQAARHGAKQIETQFANVQQELSEARDQLATTQDLFAQEREDFLARLAHHSSLLSQAAKQYGQLFSTTVPSRDHHKLKRLQAAAELKILRLERKLGNAEDQVMELAYLVRQVNDRNDLLKDQLDDALYQLSICEKLSSDTLPITADPASDSLHLQLEHLIQVDDIHHRESQAAEQRLQELLTTYYSLRSQQLYFAYTCVDKGLTQTSKLAKQHSQDLASALASHEAIAASLESVQKDRSNLSDQLCTLTAAHATLKQTCTSLEDQVATFKEQQRQTTLTHEAAVKKEKDTVQRLTNAVQKGRMAEDTLRTEIDRLLTELADAERYQEAYNSLTEEVGALLTRNQLAEQEAEHLSKFNAEILGHSNPAQRIAYVDRIRRELAEAKYKFAMLSREQEAVVELNTDLQHELDMYKSVMTADKPRTHITRVQRMPLSNVTRSLNVGMSTAQPVPQVKVVKSSISDLDAIPGDMTLDEII
ncbi:hypothetical protein P691DRAFT_776890 [Macrolepiota fuliginosa MF-IS2]|uniref:Hyaluronan-mediated motility receptor C-terminal domain-containing protein n=1 Tax=Macrolepiota fuliginosa MF-IS2 TaxID=1400762 RepID=A0A9P5X951_9AGAR|nr:hypothetical protein P691DRAFT_776890 [Macrolepiota fuliginosa MF-IS2]